MLISYKYIKKIVVIDLILFYSIGFGAAQTRRLSFPSDSCPSQLQTPGYLGSKECSKLVRIKHALEGQKFIHIQIMPNEDSIYFPLDGEQPTTEQAVEWSCAHVGSNQLNHPVTNWYVEMFGGPCADGRPNLKMGFAPLNKAEKDQVQSSIEIITLKDSRKNEVDDMDERPSSIEDSEQKGKKLNRKEAFWYTFRQIAANPVGRVLLYRLLIEIRRIDNKGNGCQSIKNGIMERCLNKRNNLRNIVIEWNDNDSHNNNRIRFNTNERECPTISALISEIGLAQIEMRPCDQVQRFFHELLHHFHQLQDKDRHDIEKNSASINDFLDKKSLSSYFWCNMEGSNNDERIKNSIIPWIRLNKKNKRMTYINLEDLRTICGSPTATLYFVKTCRNLPDFKIHNGDDLSENLFLWSLGKPLRFGHEKIPFFEDMTVVAREIEILDEVQNNYKLNEIKLPGKSYAEIVLQEGLEEVAINGLGGFLITEGSITKVLQEWN